MSTKLAISSHQPTIIHQYSLILISPYFHGSNPYSAYSVTNPSPKKYYTVTKHLPEAMAFLRVSQL